MTDLQTLRPDDDQQMAEFALSLRNLSYLLGTMTHDDGSLDKQNLAASLAALNQQVDRVSERLQSLGNTCRSCILRPTEPSRPVDVAPFPKWEPSECSVVKSSRDTGDS